MAYDLEEQESLAEIKAWWEKWGNLILTVVTVACLVLCRFSRLALVSDERIHRRRCSVCSDDSGKQYEG